MLLDLVICWFSLLLKLLQFLKISNHFYTVFSKNLYGFSIFYKVFFKIITKIIAIFENEL